MTDRRAIMLALVSAFLQRRAFSASRNSSGQPQAPGRVWRVGPSPPSLALKAAVASAHAGDTILIEAAEYRGQVAVVDKDFLRIVGTGGRPRLVAAGAHAEGKGTLVVRAHGVVIENLELVGVRVEDHYGSAIRLEKGSLLIKGCRFIDNELGVMTANEPSIQLDVVGCEFSGLRDSRGRGGALSHCLYAGAIDSLRVEGSYFHDGSVGHLIKSRARTNAIRYNRLTDQDGISSYELEFPDGGVAEVVGNLIQQGRRSESSTIISYGAERLRWKENRLDVLFNTIVNDIPAGGYFVAVRPGGIATAVLHNVLVGNGDLRLGSDEDLKSNVRAKHSDFANAGDFDFRPRLGTSWLGSVSGVEHDVLPRLLPRGQYKHPTEVEALPASRPGFLNPGAFHAVAP